ncbi:O-antigen ligase family protein [Labrys monachus]|uniref:O-antigen ligase n=1 Tax=Labrys monachus TaxID=217067 RepID=A0ABU0F7T4_9HYPH|nr:O-antigen ligase family protein [Labrys monachus]MDQ0390670.1 O-antigen ligase [Labrys monachus]
MISGQNRESGFPANIFSTVLLHGRRDLRFYLCVLTAIASLGLGGGTHGGFLSDAILQLVALPLFLVSLRDCLAGKAGGAGWLDLAFCACLAAIPISQTIPLPPSVWMHLPARETVIQAFTLTGQKPGWMPSSVLPEATASAALSLIPPFALFWGTRLLGTAHRRSLIIAILVFAAFSVFFGMAQLAGGQHSRLRLFENTNADDAVGFFANRNHFAALLYVSLLFVSAWAIDTGLTISNARRRSRLTGPRVLVLMASVTLMFLLATAQIMTRSRAGVGLTIVALLGIVVLTLLDDRNRRRRTSLVLFLVAIAAVVVFTAQFGFSRFANRFASDPLADARIVFAHTTIEAAKAYFPFGSGVGTFPSVYPMFEKPAQLLANIYANHAHDDFLEVWLESGLAGILALAALAFWIVWRSSKVWRSRDPWNMPIDILLMRATTIAVGLLGVHSIVDYPLRTTALMSLMAVCCALLTPVPQALRVLPTDEPHASKRHRHRHIRRLEPAEAGLPSSPAEVPGI